jgi:hypothetical protein
MKILLDTTVIPYYFKNLRYLKIWRICELNLTIVFYYGKILKTLRLCNYAHYNIKLSVESTKVEVVQKLNVNCL